MSKRGDPLARHSLSPAELKHLLQTERQGQPFLAVRDPGSTLELYVLGGNEHMLGRAPEMDLSLPWDDEVSGLHAELRCLGGEWALVDDGLSTNGTFVNEQRLVGRTRLRDGDLIRLGQTVIAYRAAQAVPLEETVATGDHPFDRSLTDTQRRVLVALCRPYRDRADFATPATNQQVAEEVFLSVDAVKMHLRTLFAKFGLAELPQNQKRTRLAEYALQFGLVSRRDLS